MRVLDVRLPRDFEASSRWQKDLAGGVMVVEGKAGASPQGDWSGKLYRDVVPSPVREFDLTLVPYFAWSNRGKSEMSVWLPTTQ